MALTGKLYTVIIEWDGQKPPTQWYRRRDALVGGVRGDKSQSSLERRQKDGIDGVIVQESVIICNSESLARSLAYYAHYEAGETLWRNGGDYPSVYIVEGSLFDTKPGHEKDREIVNGIQSKLGQRGRQPAKVTYQVTCLEEMTVNATDAPRGRLINCPTCGGVHIRSREGQPHIFNDSGQDIFDLWLATRFAGPHFEPATVVDNGGIDAPKVGDLLINNNDEMVIEGIKVSSDVLEIAREIAKTGRHDALLLLDAVFVGRRHNDESKRNKARIEAATQFFAQGGSPAGIVLAETPIPDLLDAATMLGAEVAAGYLLTYQHSNGNGSV